MSDSPLVSLSISSIYISTHKVALSITFSFSRWQHDDLLTIRAPHSSRGHLTKDEKKHQTMKNFNFCYFFFSAFFPNLYILISFGLQACFHPSGLSTTAVLLIRGRKKRIATAFRHFPYKYCLLMRLN